MLFSRCTSVQTPTFNTEMRKNKREWKRERKRAREWERGRERSSQRVNEQMKNRKNSTITTTQQIFLYVRKCKRVCIGKTTSKCNSMFSRLIFCIVCDFPNEILFVAVVIGIRYSRAEKKPGKSTICNL